MANQQRLQAVGVFLVIGGVACMATSLAMAQRATQLEASRVKPPTLTLATVQTRETDLGTHTGRSIDDASSSRNENGRRYSGDYYGTPNFGYRDYPRSGGQVRVGSLRFGWR